MPRPDQETVLKALDDFISFGHEIGLPNVVKPLELFAIEFRTTKPTRGVLQDSLYPALCDSYYGLMNRVLNNRRQPRPGMKKHEGRLHGTYNALFDLIHPPKHANVIQTEVIGLARNTESTSVLGDPQAAKHIAGASLEVVQRFSKAVFRRDIETAYALCANEQRVNMSLKQFMNKLSWADSHYGGPALDLLVERIGGIYADTASRKRSNTDGDWPKETPKPNKRAYVGTFWLTDKKQKCGRWVLFWVTEEAEGYRIAKFKQYLQ